MILVATDDNSYRASAYETTLIDNAVIKHQQDLLYWDTDPDDKKTLAWRSVTTSMVVMLWEIWRPAEGLEQGEGTEV